jgi:hypothetical protein
MIRGTRLPSTDRIATSIGAVGGMFQSAAKFGGRVRRELQADFDLGIVAGKSNAATHERYIWSLGLLPTRPTASFSSLLRIECLAAEALHERCGILGFREAIHIEPLAVMEDRMVARAKR